MTMNDNLIIVRLSSGKRWVERKSGLLWGLYWWRGGPRFHLVIGSTNTTDTILEIGVLGRSFYVAPEPKRA